MGCVMTCGVYKITNKLTGEIYIGASSNIEKRWNNHKNNSNVKEINNFNTDDFSFEILAEYPKEDVYNKEKEYIGEYKRYYKLYNKSAGGENPYNTTGYYKVGKHIISSRNGRQNIVYRYRYIDQKGKEKFLENVNIKVLEKKVKENNLPWKILDEKKAKQTLKESNERIKKYFNSTGYYRVSRNKDKRAKQGFSYRYRYYDENKKEKCIRDVSISNLEKKVKAKGLPWIVLNEESVNETLEEDMINSKIRANNNTGFYNVTKIKSKNNKQGFIFRYNHYENNERKPINSVSIKKLEEKVKSKKLLWKVVDKDLANKILMQDYNI